MIKKKEPSKANLLHLTPEWRKSKAPSVPDKKRYNAMCKKCDSYFFGDTQGEANDRRDNHHCFG